MSDENLYRAQWDNYAKVLGARHFDGSATEEKWPGDEWGSEERWSKIFEEMFLNFGAKDWQNCVEIGPGSGKYTSLLLRNSRSHIIAFDISATYLELMKKRLASDVAEQRLESAVIKAERSDELLKYLEGKSLVRKLDAFYSMDAMVHVDLSYLSVYLMTAALTLKEGGLLIMDVANVVSTSGFKHLLTTSKKYYPLQGKPTAKLEYQSPDIVNYVWRKMGFEVNFLRPFGQAIEDSPVLYVVGKLVDTGPADTLRAAISE